MEQQSKETKQENKKLTSKQLQHLRGLGHHLKPIVMLGREGVSDNVISAANAVLAAHELIKVKIGNGCLLERREAADVLAESTGSQVVQILGKTLLLYRANSELDKEKRINLPR